MSLLDRIMRFFRPPATGTVRTTDPFVHIVRKRAIEKLRLEQRAMQNGARNHPPPQASDLDEVEQEIVAEFREYAARARSEAAANHKVYGERLAELSLLRELSSVTASCEAALGDFNNTVLNTRSRLSVAGDAVRESFQELMEFKQAHNLKGPALKGISSLLFWSTLLLSWVVESVLNALMLKINDDYGYLGGFLAALVIAAVNIGLSAFVGRFAFPNLYHRSVPRKLSGLLALLLWLCFVLSWNLLAAHFRDAKAAGLAMPEQQALVEFLRAPLQLDSIYSYGLLVMGVVFAILAAVTALKKKDPYPGYGDLYERHEERCHDYADELDHATERLTAIRNAATGKAMQDREQLGIQFRERGNIIASREFHRSAYHNHHQHLEEMCNALLQYYRERNRQARTDGLAPSHFNQPLRLDFTPLPHPAEEPTTQAEVQAAQRALSECIERIGAAYDEAIRSFKYLDAIKQELRHG